MAELKTKPTAEGVAQFLKKITDPRRQKDCEALAKQMKKITGADPIMWGPGIIGFGSYHYKYASGREGDWFLTGFSPRKQNLTLYIMSGFREYAGLLSKLGKFKTGKACLYVNKLEDIDLKILSELITKSVTALRQKSR